MDPGEDDFPKLHAQHNGERYLTPVDLAARPVKLKRVLLVGSCLAGVLHSNIDCPCDFVLSNNLGRLPEHPPQPIGSYDFQIVQVPLRFVMTDAALWGPSFLDDVAYEVAFEEALQRLRQLLSVALGWNAQHGIPTFCSNFLVPQQNPMGRLMPRYELRNPVYFVEQLNLYLAKELKAYRNVYLLDVEGLSAVFGKKNIQDDAVEVLAHGGLLGDFAYERDMERTEAIAPMTEHYDLRQKEFASAVWRHAEAMYKTLVQEDAVKLVIVDLDNTLWRGVIGEGEEIDGLTNEGWPLGLTEALAYLRKRGVVLAIASQNEESKIRAVWPQIMHDKISIDDFAVIKINWKPKVDNIEEILRVVNVLPRHTVFIDDNPVERARVQSVFPEMRVLGRYPYYLKRILLWSPETQVPFITAESSTRSEAIRSQVVREDARLHMTREEFLATLNVKVETAEVRSLEDANFPRAFELVNKTNQFNTTGKRWSREECEELFRSGSGFLVFKVADRFSDYGLVGCAIVSSDTILQFVMSCRVLGLDVERTVVTEIIARMQARGAKLIHGNLVETPDNFPCRDLYRNCGFAQNSGVWTKSLSTNEAASRLAG